jgi:AcrR family transcriptional regulator
MKGYGAASVQDVADEIGLLKGSIYHYIKTKEDLLFAVSEDAHAASMHVVEKLQTLNVDPAAEFSAFVGAHLDLLITERIKLSVYLHDFRSLTEEHHSTVAGHRRRYSQYVEDLIRRGQRDSVFASRIDPHLLMLSVLGMLNWTYEWYRDDGDTSREDVIAAFVETALRSVGTDADTVTRVVASHPAV